MSILTRPASSAFGIVSVNTPSTNLADTLLASTCVGRVMLRVNVVRPVDSRSTEILVGSDEAANGSAVRNFVRTASQGVLTFLGLSVGRCLDSWLSPLSGRTDDLALDGHAPTVVSNLDVDVLLADARQLGLDDVRVALLCNVNSRAQSIPSQSKERVIEHRLASAVVSNRGPTEEWVLEYAEERTEFAEEVAAERHPAGGGEVLGFEVRRDCLTPPVYISCTPSLW